MDSGGKLSTRLYDKRDDFHFHIANIPFLSSSIPSGPSYGVYISKLIRYERCCSHYDDFRYCHKCLVDRPLSQGYIALRLEKFFKKFYGRYQDFIDKIAEVSQGNDERFIPKIIFIITCSRNLVAFVTYLDLSLRFVHMGVMHEADDAYSIQSTWSCYLARSISRSSTQYMESVETFNISLDFINDDNRH